ncbi:MAG: tRNA (adenosine(37)-N6)-threonylcarbamoyltransferase complex dimerization subunit type 1 TsaB [Methylococcales bacterium]
MKLLAVETCTDACSAALSIDNEIIERFQLAPQAHTKLILPMIDSLMAEAGLALQDLDGLAFSRGPGSFTGVRIATAVIQGIALGGDLPVVGVSTLAALAQHFFNQQTETDVAFVAMDARMSETFWAVYQRDADNTAQLLGKEAVTPAQLIEFPDLPGVGIGSGWGVYEQELSACLGNRVRRFEVEHLPRAGAVAQLGVHGFARGLAVAVEDAMPVYLRDKVAKKEAER